MKKMFASAFAVLVCAGLSAAVPKALVDLPLNEGDFNAVKNYGSGAATVKVMHPEQLKWVEGPDGKAIEFHSQGIRNGRRGHVQITLPKGFDLQKPFSLSFLIKTDKALPKKGIISVFQYADGYFRSAGLNLLISWNMFWFRYGVKGKHGDLQTKLSEKSILPDTWYRFAAVSNGKEAILYLDGKVAAKGPIQIANPSSPQRFILGAGCDGAGYGFSGIITRFKLFDKALTPAEIAELQSR